MYPNCGLFAPHILSCPTSHFDQVLLTVFYICSALLWRSLFPIGLWGWQDRYSPHFSWTNGAPKRMGGLPSSHGFSFVSPGSFQLRHAASSPEGLGNISNCLQEICFTFLHRHSVPGEPDSMETEPRGCVYMAFPPGPLQFSLEADEPLCISRWVNSNPYPL